MPYWYALSVFGDLPRYDSKVMPGDIFRMSFLDVLGTPSKLIQTSRQTLFEGSLTNPLVFVEQECRYMLQTYTSLINHPSVVIDSVISAMHHLFCFADQQQHVNSSSRAPKKYAVVFFCVYDPWEPYYAALQNYYYATTQNYFVSLRVQKPLREDIIKYLRKKKSTVQLDCTICLSALYGDDNEGYAMHCDHVFHQHCILTWLQINGSCPLCRQRLPPLTRDVLIKWF